MRRFPWEVVLALLAGIGMGLVYAWMISPMKVTNADPSTLRADFKDHYRSAIAAAYAATGNLPRARARLELLQDPNPVEILHAQAQRMLAQGNLDQAADLIAAFALAVEAQGRETGIRSDSPVTEVAIDLESANITPSIESDVAPLQTESSMTVTGTPAPQVSATHPAGSESTPRPAQTQATSAVISFELTGQEEMCDPNLPDGLLQVMVVTASRRQIPGMEISVTWEGGAEQFFTGLKPELGNGYADFIMDPNVPYTVQLAEGSDIAAGLTAPTCQSAGGESFFGGVKLTFQQP